MQVSSQLTDFPDIFSAEKRVRYFFSRFWRNLRTYITCLQVLLFGQLINSERSSFLALISILIYIFGFQLLFILNCTRSLYSPRHLFERRRVRADDFMDLILGPIDFDLFFFGLHKLLSLLSTNFLIRNIGRLLCSLHGHLFRWVKMTLRFLPRVDWPTLLQLSCLLFPFVETLMLKAFLFYLRRTVHWDILKSFGIEIERFFLTFQQVFRWGAFRLQRRRNVWS